MIYFTEQVWIYCAIISEPFRTGAVILPPCTARGYKNKDLFLFAKVKIYIGNKILRKLNRLEFKYIHKCL